MAVHHRVFAQALGAGGAHIVFADDFHHRGAGNARHEAHFVEAQGQRGPDHLVQVDQRVIPQVSVVQGGQPSHMHQHQQQQDGDEKGGHSDAGHGEDPRRIVQRAFRAQRGNYPQRHCHDDRDKHGHDGQLDRHRNPVGQFFHHRGLEPVGIPEISLHDAANPVYVLVDQRFVQVEFNAAIYELFLRVRGLAVTEYGDAHVARNKAHHHKHDYGDENYRRDEEPNSLDYVLSHALTPTLSQRERELFRGRIGSTKVAGEQDLTPTQPSFRRKPESTIVKGDTTLLVKCAPWIPAKAGMTRLLSSSFTH